MYENTANLPAGVSAVKDTFSINVLVVDNGDGTLSATVNYPGDGLAFENSYDATDAELYINGAKRLMVGDELAGPGYITGKYQFTITGGDGAPMPGETTVANQAGGTVEFGPISYDKAGTYTYTITESGHVNGVTNDADATKTVTVKVTDEGGHLVAQKVDSDGVAVQGPDFIFTNTYGVEDKTLSGDDALRATKVLEGPRPQGRRVYLLAEVWRGRCPPVRQPPTTPMETWSLATSTSSRQTWARPTTTTSPRLQATRPVSPTTPLSTK